MHKYTAPAWMYIGLHGCLWLLLAGERFRLFSYTRNPNFLGEFFIYSSYAILANHWLGYLVLAYAIVFFYSRMYTKDASISRYPEWEAYAARSNRLFPFKLLTQPFRNALPVLSQAPVVKA